MPPIVLIAERHQRGLLPYKPENALEVAVVAQPALALGEGETVVAIQLLPDRGIDVRP